MLLWITVLSSGNCYKRGFQFAQCINDLNVLSVPSLNGLIKTVTFNEAKGMGS